MIDHGLQSLIKPLSSDSTPPSDRNESRASYMAAFDEINDAVFVHDMNSGAILNVNRCFCAMYGYTAEEAKKMTVAQLTANLPSYNDENALKLIRAAAAGSPQLFEWPAKDKSGRPFWVEVNLRRAHLDGADVLLALVRNIDQRKRLESVQKAHLRILEAALKSEDMEKMLNVVQSAISSLMDAPNFIVALYDHRTGAVSFPVLMDSVIGTDFQAHRLIKTLTDKVKCAGVPLAFDRRELYLMADTGESDSAPPVPYKWLGIPLRSDEGVFGVAAVYDYTENQPYRPEDLQLAEALSPHIVAAIMYRMAEDDLRESERKNRSLIDAIPDGLVVVDSDLKIIYANPAACEIGGYTHDELLKLDLPQIIVEEDRALFFAQVNARKGKAVGKYEMAIRRKDGKVRNLLVSAAPVIGHDGDVTGSMGVFRDITEQKKAEKDKQELRERLARAQRMESLGMLASGVAHDLNNILGPLTAYPDIIRTQISADSPALTHLDKMESSAQKAAQAVQDLLTMARRDRYEMTTLDFNSIVRNWVECPELRQLQKKHQAVSTEINLADGRLMVRGSMFHLTKLVTNLVINAFDAMTTGGILRISTRSSKVDKLLGGFDGIEKGEYAILTVSDTGIGIEPNDLKRIFEPFYSKKQLGRSGSGLGLSIVYGIVKDHNGYIDVASSVNSGTEFVVYLPLVEDGQAGESKQIDIRGCEKILVVDDLEEQRELASIILGSLGYNVSVASSGEESIELLRAGDFDVVVLDMIMEGGMDGLDTYLEILKIKPDTKVIIASGYSESERVIEAEKRGVRAYLKKPYTMQQLGKTIRNVIAMA